MFITQGTVRDLCQCLQGFITYQGEFYKSITKEGIDSFYYLGYFLV